MLEANNKNELGYLPNGEPSDAQMELQDTIDSATQEYVQNMYDIYAGVLNLEPKEIEHDINILTRIREEFELALDVEDIY